MKKYGMFVAASFCFFSCSADVDAPVDAKADINSNVTINNYGDINTNKKQPSEASEDIIEDVPKCTAKKDGQLQFIESNEIVIGCYDETWYNVEYDFIADDFESMIKCTSKRSGVISYDIDGNKLYYCNNEKWMKITLDELMEASSSSSKGSSVFDDDEDEDVKSSSSKKSSAFDEDDEDEEVEKSSSSKNSSSSAKIDSEDEKEDEPASSESQKSSASTKVSSSSKTESSDEGDGEEEEEKEPNVAEIKAAASYTCTASKVMFCGSDIRPIDGNDVQVQTELDDGSGTSGWWHAWSTKRSEGGTNKTYMEWPAGFDEDACETGYCVFSRPSTENYNAIYGIAHIYDTDKNPYAGLGFNVSGGSSAANITAWGGLCIVYTTSQNMKLQLQPAENIREEMDGYDDYSIELPATDTKSIANISWDEFKQDGWGVTASKSIVLKSTQKISFNFYKSQSPGTTSFKIFAVGKYGTCN